MEGIEINSNLQLEVWM